MFVSVSFALDYFYIIVNYVYMEVSKHFEGALYCGMPNATATFCSVLRILGQRHAVPRLTHFDEIRHDMKHTRLS